MNLIAKTALVGFGLNALCVTANFTCLFWGTHPVLNLLSGLFGVFTCYVLIHTHRSAL